MTENKRFDGEMTYYAQIYDNEGITWALETRGDIREFCKLLNKLDAENKELKVTMGEMEDYLARMEEEKKELKSLCKVLIKHIEKKSIAFVMDEEVRRLLE